MQVSEVCKQTGLTKKAIEYYQSKGLISPKVSDNGYREFSDSDVSRLQEIALLRRLDLGTDEVRQVVESSDKQHALVLIKQAKEMQAKAKLARLELMDQLIDGVDVADIQASLNLLEQQCTIGQKLLAIFPGYYGKYLSLHFGQFLNEPLMTDEQKTLFSKIVKFLDDVEPIDVPAELQSFLDDADKQMDEEDIKEVSVNIQSAYADFDAFWENNKDSIAQYLDFKNTSEYQNSAMAQLMDLFRKFGETSGYYDVFIPMMRKLSPSYDAYYRKMLEANAKLMQKMSHAISG